MKNPTHCIDDLWKAVNPSLIAGYESKNNLGATLKWMNEGYKIDYIESDKHFRNTLIIATILIPIVVALLTKAESYFKSGYSTTYMGIAALLFCWLVIDRRFKKQREYTLGIKEFEKSLKEFRQSVLALNPSVGTIREYTTGSIRENLVSIACQLRIAEIDSEKVRLNLTFSMSDVVRYGEWEKKWRYEFEDILNAAEKFGLTFVNSEIIKKAEKILVKRNRKF